MIRSLILLRKSTTCLALSCQKMILKLGYRIIVSKHLVRTTSSQRFKRGIDRSVDCIYVVGMHLKQDKNVLLDLEFSRLGNQNMKKIKIRLILHVNASSSHQCFSIGFPWAHMLYPKPGASEAAFPSCSWINRPEQLGLKWQS